MINKAKDIINKRGVESIRSTGRIFRQFKSYDGKDKVEVKLLARDNSLAGKITKGLFTSLPGVYKLEK